MLGRGSCKGRKSAVGGALQLACTMHPAEKGSHWMGSADPSMWPTWLHITGKKAQINLGKLEEATWTQSLAGRWKRLQQQTRPSLKICEQFKNQMTGWAAAFCTGTRLWWLCCAVVSHGGGTGVCEKNCSLQCQKGKSDLWRRNRLIGFWGERRKWEHISQRSRAQMKTMSVLS